jgi:DNA polymerase-3 subunit alpha (Gram-positive type)
MVPFYDMFSCCRDDKLFGILNEASVLSAVIERDQQRMKLVIKFPKKPAPVILSLAEAGIAAEFDLKEVSITAVMPTRAVTAKKTGKNTGKPAMLHGKAIRGHCVPINELTQDSGKVTVEGEVFSLDVREVRNGTAKIVEFDITDYMGSVRVSKFLREDESSRLYEVEKGMCLKVQGMYSFNRFHGDMSIDPIAVEVINKACRTDRSENGKRVELHMHSRLSALDALTDIDAVVQTAARWGHKAIAITDHGVTQAFPHIAKAGKQNGVKILYGIEGYFINDVDDRVAVSGDRDASLDDEFVVFDLETTGLSCVKDKITEIGAVILKDGAAGRRFQTYVNPGMQIPYEITKLTGISDENVSDAPSQEEELRDFLAFVGDRPLAAHNADFDIGFIAEGCKRLGTKFDNSYIDTVTLGQVLLPELKKHTLDSIAKHLELPEFTHHRAADDAETLSMILTYFFGRLKEMGISVLSEINPQASKIRVSRRFSKRAPRHIIILVKEQKGLKNLYKMVSYSHLDHFKKHPIILKSVLSEHREGLIVGSACENGEIFKAVLTNKSERELKRLADFYDYLEIQPTANNGFLIDNGTVRDEDELREINKRIVKLGEETQKPVVATGDVHFLEPEHEIFRRILLSNKFSDVDRPLPLYLKTTDEMLEEFSYLGKEKAYKVVVTNTNKIADSCDTIKPLPDDLYIPKMENSIEELNSIVYGKLTELYGENPPEIVKDRVDTEMKDIIGCGYHVIYMSAQKLVAKSLESGYLVGSRGSVGSSLAAYMAGITEVNALPPHYRCPNCKHCDFESGKGYGCGVDMPDDYCPGCGTKYEKEGFDIPFETFLGFGGDKVPDIDLNFSGEYQALAHKHAIELFGEDYVFRAGTIGGIADKTAYGYVKNYLAERGLKVSKVEEARLAAGLTGVKRTTGQHPGGLVVIPNDMEIYDFCPVQHPADSIDSDIITTHYEYHTMESNLLKLDLLGHDDPSMIKMLEDLTGVNAQKIPLDDPETMSIFKSTKALGLPEDDPIIGKTGSIAVPEFGTKFTREMLQDTLPEQFSILVRLSGFSHGTDVWLGNAKDLIVSKTATVNEVIGCRDDIMLYLISMGMDAHKAFFIMEKVRKGRGLTDEEASAMRMLNVPEWYIESCKKIKYLFPKAHAVAYVMMAMRIAWFKVHKPLEFYCAYFSVRAPAFDLECMTSGIDKVRVKIRELENKQDIKQAEKDLLLSLEVCYEMYSRGFVFKSVDFYKSDATKFKIDGNALIPPFTAIAGLGEATARDLEAVRQEASSFVSVEEIAAKCPKASKTNIEQLKKAGAFGDLPETAQLSFF